MRLRLEFGPRHDREQLPGKPDGLNVADRQDLTGTEQDDAATDAALERDLDVASQRPPKRFLSNVLQRVKRSGAGEFAAPASTRVFLVLLVMAMLCGPAALILLLLAPPPVISAAAPSSAGAETRDPIRAAAAAEQLVRVWLSAGRDDAESVRAAMGRDPGQLRLPDQRPTPPSWVEVSDVTPTRAGEWAVTVAAAGGLAAGRAAYTVLVSTTPEAATPLTLPARVPPPQPGDLGPDDLESLSDNHPVTVTTGGFLRALLTGTDDMSRWAAPESPVQPLGSVCRSVILDRLQTTRAEQDATGLDSVTVLATVTCTSTAIQAKTPPVVYTLQYPLTLHLRDGRWEVAGYATTLPVGVPPAAGSEPSTQPSAPTPPTPTTTASGPPPSGTR